MKRLSKIRVSLLLILILLVGGCGNSLVPSVNTFDLLPTVIKYDFLPAMQELISLIGTSALTSIEEEK